MKKIENRPNFFIIGAPKCGTTALVEYLTSHPNVFITKPKEPHYFATDIPDYRYCKTEEEYSELFTGVTEDQSAIGEGSVFYLYSKEAIKNISQYNQNAKIIIMLRNPVDMVYSFHAQLVRSSDENILDFRKAWDLVDERKQNRSISKYTRESKLLFYDEIARYDEQIERVFKYFPAENVKIILFEEFIDKTREKYLQVLKFLNLPDDGKSEFQIINENKIIKVHWLNRALKKQSRVVFSLKEFLKKIFGVEILGLRKVISDLNSIKRTRNKLDDNLAFEIFNKYHSSIERLSRIINKDLSQFWSLQKK